MTETPARDRTGISWPVVAAGLAVLLAVALLLLVSGALGDGDEPDPSPGAAATLRASAPPGTAQSEATPGAATPIPSDPSTPPPSASVANPVAAGDIGEPTISWTEGSPIAGSAYTAAWMGDRWLVGGGSGGRAAVWTSTDGLTRSAAQPIDPPPVDGAVEGGPSAHWISAFADWQGQLVAAGVRRFGRGDGAHMAMWTSTDGEAWQHSDLSEVDEGGTFPTVAMAPDERLVIIGQGALGSATFIYATTDGVTWEASSLAPPDVSGDGLTDVAGGPPTLLGTGYSGSVQVAENQHSPVSAIWTSQDWVSWERLVTGSPGGLGAIAYDAQGDRFIAGGRHVDPATNANRSPVVWLSDGAGRVWTPVILDPGSGNVADLDVANGLILAVGALFDAGAIMLWESRDGTTWAARPFAIDTQSRPLLLTHEDQALLLISLCCDIEQTRVWTTTVAP